MKIATVSLEVLNRWGKLSEYLPSYLGYIQRKQRGCVVLELIHSHQKKSLFLLDYCKKPVQAGGLIHQIICRQYHGTTMVMEVNCSVLAALVVPWWKIKYSTKSLELPNSFRSIALEWALTDGVPVFRTGFASKSSQAKPYIYIWREMTLKNILMSTF